MANLEDFQCSAEMMTDLAMGELLVRGDHDQHDMCIQTEVDRQRNAEADKET
jgi:hypothetical protein